MNDFYDMESNDMAQVLHSNDEFLLSEDLHVDDPTNPDRNFQHFLTSWESSNEFDLGTNMKLIPREIKKEEDNMNLNISLSDMKEDIHALPINGMSSLVRNLQDKDEHEHVHLHDERKLKLKNFAKSRQRKSKIKDPGKSAAINGKPFEVEDNLSIHEHLPGRRSDDITMYSSSKDVSIVAKRKPIFITQKARNKKSKHDKETMNRNIIKNIMKQWKMRESTSEDISDSCGRSISTVSKEEKKTERQMKNRISAKKCRQKKKEYIRCLEKELSQVKRELEFARHSHTVPGIGQMSLFDQLKCVIISTIPGIFKFLEKSIRNSSCIEDLVSNVNKNQLMMLDLFNFETCPMENNIAHLQMTDTISFPHQLYMYLEQLKLMIYQFREFHMEVKKLEDINVKVNLRK